MIELVDCRCFVQQPEGEKDVLEQIVELREYDVLYVQRVCIDHDIRVGEFFVKRCC